MQSTAERDYYYSELAEDAEFTDLVEYFVAEVPQRLGLLESRCSAGDWMELAELAHQWKGAAGSYGFPQMTEPLQTLETRASIEPDSAQIKQALQLVRETACRLQAGPATASC